MTQPIKASDHKALNEAFAEKVAGWQKFAANDEIWWENVKAAPLDGPCFCLPEYTNWTEGILPYLEKQYTWNLERDAPLKTPRRYLVSLYAVDTEQGWYSAWGDTFPHAAVICLLRAVGVEVIDDE